jgi:hypothetical protein
VAVGDEGDDRQDTEPGARVALLEAALAERNAQLAALSEQVARQAEQIERLTELVNRNSKNSHLPPSSDGPGSGGSAAGTRRQKSGRKRGGQKGHRGSHRELMRPERVDTAADHPLPAAVLTTAGKYRIRCRSPTLRTRPSALSLAIGR